MLAQFPPPRGFAAGLPSQWGGEETVPPPPRGHRSRLLDGGGCLIRRGLDLAGRGIHLGLNILGCSLRGCGGGGRTGLEGRQALARDLTYAVGRRLACCVPITLAGAQPLAETA